MTDCRSQESNYFKGVRSVLSGEFQSRHERRKKLEIHPDYCLKKVHGTESAIDGTFVLRAISSRGFCLRGKDLGEIPYSQEEVDQLVDTKGEPLTLNRIHFMKALNNLIAVGLVHHMINSDVGVTSMGRDLIGEFEDQPFTVYPDAGVIHPATISKAHHVYDMYAQRGSGSALV